MKKPLSVLIYYQGGLWVAMGIEHCIATQAATLEQVAIDFQWALHEHVETAKEEGIEPFVDFPPAPEEVQERYRNAHLKLLNLGIEPPSGLVVEVEALESIWELQLSEIRVAA